MNLQVYVYSLLLFFLLCIFFGECWGPGFLFVSLLTKAANSYWFHKWLTYAYYSLTVNAQTWTINAYSSITANGYNTVNGYIALTVNNIILHQWLTLTMVSIASWWELVLVWSIVTISAISKSLRPFSWPLNSMTSVWLGNIFGRGVRLLLLRLRLSEKINNRKHL